MKGVSFKRMPKSSIRYGDERSSVYGNLSRSSGSILSESIYSENLPRSSGSIRSGSIYSENLPRSSGSILSGSIYSVNPPRSSGSIRSGSVESGNLPRSSGILPMPSGNTSCISKKSENPGYWDLSSLGTSTGYRNTSRSSASRSRSSSTDIVKTPGNVTYIHNENYFNTINQPQPHILQVVVSEPPLPRSGKNIYSKLAFELRYNTSCCCF